MEKLLEKIGEILFLWSKWAMDFLKPRTIFAAMFYTTLCYLIVKQLPIPEILKNVISFLMGFYFGQKTKKEVI